MGDAANIGLLCPACFHAKPDTNRCSNCGWLDGGKSVPPFHLPLGTVLRDNYILGKALGQGGFGITYIAWDPALQVRRAIKEYYPIECAARAPNQHTISPYTGEAEESFRFGLDRFMEEARKLAQFRDHPHIVTVLEYFRDNHTAYMVMDFLPGKTLENYLRDRGGRIPYATAKNIMVRVMDALRSVHESNLLHRDVSPQNIYITDDGKVKLLDFGSARQATGSHSQTLQLMIKQGYSPPEQYTKQGHLAAWTDVYATGATFYRAVTGEVPPESLVRGESDTLRPISEFCDDVPERVERAIRNALEVKPENRFQTIKAFQDEIVAPYPEEVKQEPPPDPKRPPPKGSVWKKVAIAASVLFVLAAGGYMYAELMDQREQLERVRRAETKANRSAQQDAGAAAEAEAQRRAQQAAEAEAQRRAQQAAETEAQRRAQQAAEAEAQRQAQQAAEAEAQRRAQQAAEAQKKQALISEAQRQLTRLGYNPGPVDGRQGRNTTRAVRSFQTSRGMRDDGVIDERLVVVLKNARPLSEMVREPPPQEPPPFDPRRCPPSNRSTLEDIQFYAGFLNSVERLCEVYEYCRNRQGSIFQDLGKGSAAVPCSKYPWP